MAAARHRTLQRAQPQGHDSAGAERHQPVHRRTDCAGARVLDYIRTDALFGGRFANLQFKESLSAKQPFRRMLVKRKREIITMKSP